MRKNIIILFVGIAIILSFTYYYSIQGNVKENINDDTYENASLNVISYITELEPNINPVFKPGQIWIYEDIPSAVDRYNKDKTIHEYTVKDIYRFNKTDCFIVVGNLTEYSNDQEISNTLVTTCVDKNGDILFYSSTGSTQRGINSSTYFEGDNASNEINGASGAAYFLYGPWMLSLTKNFKWKQNITLPGSIIMMIKKEDGRYEISERKGMEYHIMDYLVVGEENADNRDCFKVQVKERFIAVDGKETLYKYLLWIDANERILIKGERYIENLYMGEIRLISEK